MSWGIKITVLYIGFVLMIAVLIIRTTRENVDLVADDYYQQELDYQNTIDQRTAVSVSGMEPIVKLNSEEIEITFPVIPATDSYIGTIRFYRPSDATKDFTVEIQPDSNRVQRIALSSLTQGVYQMKFAWSADQKYYSETQLYVP